MNLSRSLGGGGADSLAVLLEDSERVLCRGWRDDGDGNRTAVFAVLPASAPPTPGLVDRLAHEYALRDELDGRSAVRPLALVREHGRTMLPPKSWIPVVLPGARLLLQIQRPLDSSRTPSASQSLVQPGHIGDRSYLRHG
jgi:hypothetical protein